MALTGRGSYTESGKDSDELQWEGVERIKIIMFKIIMYKTPVSLKGYSG